jgi:M6 family metalloprotease-like protein
MQPLKQVLLACFLALTLSLLVCISGASASPAAPLEFTLTQPDGSSFPARAWGDEWSNGYETLAGYTIQQASPDGWWVYARLQADGSLNPASSAQPILRVGIDVPEGLEKHLRPIAGGATARLRNTPQTGLSTAGEYHLPPASGDMPVLVLLVKFTDINETYPSSDFEQLVFGATDSLKSYYSEVSYGALNLVPAEESCGTPNDGITDWTTLAYAHPNPVSTSTDDNQLITKDVLAANDACIDFASFDVNMDGGLSADELQIIVVVAGWERAYGDYSAPSIWAHSFYLDFVETPSLDGTVIGSYYQQSYYAQIGEIHGTGIDQHRATLGPLAHEFGHLLNWPDLYDIDGSSEGVGRWSIMGSGGWNQTGSYAGDTPAHPDAWSKWYQGWLEPVEVTGSITDAQIEQAADHPSAYLLRPNVNGIDWIFNYHTGRGEYFLVENRQPSLSDAGLPGCGLLVWHVNENQTFNNFANARELTPLVSLVQADGDDDLLIETNRGDAGDPYPGDGNNHLFNVTSDPDSRLQNGGVSGVTMLVDSTGCAEVMQVDFSYHLDRTILLKVQKPDPECQAWDTVFTEDFEDGLMDGWTATDENGSEYGEYLPAVSSCRAAGGSRSAWMIGGGVDGSALGCGAYYPDRMIPWLVYGPISTKGETAMRLDFSHWTYIEPAVPFYIFDRHCVWASEDNELYIGYCFTGESGGWSDYSFNLKDAGGFYDFLDKSQVWLAFSMMSDDYIHFPEGGYVDNIALKSCASASGDLVRSPLTIQSGTSQPGLPDALMRFFQWPKLNNRSPIIGPLFVRRPVGQH